MRNILCYGDSNTFGCCPEDMDKRFDETTRWTGRLQRLLGKNWNILEAGFNGRTTVFDDPMAPYRNGAAMLSPILESQRPLDGVVLMLGTNDSKSLFNASPLDIGRGMERLVQIVRSYPCGRTSQQHPQILILAPIRIRSEALNTPLGARYGAAALEKIEQLPKIYQQIAGIYGCEADDAGQWAEASKIDGIHMDADGHAALAEGVAKRLLNLTF